ncbi:unnamed protein product [Urochloa humidicola]
MIKLPSYFIAAKIRMKVSIYAPGKKSYTMKEETTTREIQDYLLADMFVGEDLLVSTGQWRWTLIYGSFWPAAALSLHQYKLLEIR